MKIKKSNYKIKKSDVGRTYIVIMGLPVAVDYLSKKLSRRKDL